MGRLIILSVFLIFISCETNTSSNVVDKDDNNELGDSVLLKSNNYCVGNEIIMEINDLVNSQANYDSVLAILDNSYLPVLIKVQYECPVVFYNISLKALLQYHRSEVKKGYSDGALISTKAYDYLCLLLFQSGYMKKSGNYNSSSRTLEVLKWAKENKNALDNETRQIINKAAEAEG